MHVVWGNAKRFFLKQVVAGSDRPGWNTLKENIQINLSNKNVNNHNPEIAGL